MLDVAIRILKCLELQLCIPRFLEIVKFTSKLVLIFISKWVVTTRFERKSSFEINFQSII